MIGKNFLGYNMQYAIVAGGRRGNMTLGHILCFATATDEEPVLGYSLAPALQFIESACFLPTANTCINRMNLTRGSKTLCHLQILLLFCRIQILF